MDVDNEDIMDDDFEYMNLQYGKSAPKKSKQTEGSDDYDPSNEQKELDDNDIEPGMLISLRFLIIFNLYRDHN